ncbi:MAG: hypothetical protein RL701_5821 [Pseudomonadota bacterium]|jgi:hypothetical protein
MSNARVLWLVYLVVGTTGCIWLDDFNKFSISDSGVAGGSSDAGRRDAGSSDDAGPDGAQDRCKNVDCGKLTAECTRGRCNPATGACESLPINNGQACFDGNPCTERDRCRAGACVGEALNCAGFDDECSQGACDPELGGCTFGKNRMSQTCDDANPCTLGDRCTEDGLCLAQSNANSGAKCDDFNACTGTENTPDHCNGSGRCIDGAPVAAGSTCDDDSECTGSDKCDGDGECHGTAVREGQPCEQACTGNTTCQAGVCKPANDATPAYDPSCVLNFCGRESICRASWEGDRVCHCGCDFDDPDCSACSARMCQSDRSLGHEATKWCGNGGRVAENCPDSLKTNGRCDCGCQFADPECNGGSCCDGTGKAGCGNAFVEACVCKHETNADPSCCRDAWTPRCAELAVNLGCMLCP